ncbi:hypothetical protein BDW59DRAFT_176883 [Aspergillus cavernicola]|uniref:Protein kinase domain-containing protein n=1 Tax=Aspergillus cavernicola TaxID=176166 RepID=A0ABR4HBQ9_9EURO
MRPSNQGSLDVVSANIQIVREVDCSDASSVFKIELEGRNCAMKLVKHGVCETGFVPYFYGHIDRIDPAAFYPAFQHFAHDKYHPKAILLEYLPNAESLNCENYSEACYYQVIEGMKQIHAARVHHQDIYPKNILVVPGGPDEQRLSEEEDTLVAEFGEFLRADQRQGLCKNTKWY